MEVDDNDKDAIEEPKLQSKCSFCEDLKAKEILNIPSDVTVTTDGVLEMNDVCSENVEEDVSNR